MTTPNDQPSPQPDQGGHPKLTTTSDQPREITLTELGQLTNRTPNALRQLLKRGKLTRGRGTNVGKVTVLVSLADLAKLTTPDGHTDQPLPQPDQGGQPVKKTQQPPQATTPDLTPLTNLITGLTTQLEAKNQALLEAHIEIATLKEKLHNLEKKHNQSWIKTILDRFTQK